MIPGQKEGVRILQICLKMPVVFEFSLITPPFLHPGIDCGGTAPRLCSKILNLRYSSVAFSDLILQSCTQRENGGRLAMFRARRRGTCNRKPEFLRRVSTSEQAEKIGGFSAVFTVEYPFVSHLAELLVYARHGHRHVCRRW